MPDRHSQGVRLAQAGLLINILLVIAKLLSGILGHTYALIADAAESSADIFASIIVWRGLRIAAQPPDHDHPFGHGRAEPIAAAVVSLMLLGAALGIFIVAIREIITPHQIPAPFTLFVAGGVILVKELLYRRGLQLGDETGSPAIVADAWHHRSDAISSGAAFVGIALALLGGPGWESADDWAALVAALIIAVNGVFILRPAIDDLMDRVPDGPVLDQIAGAAQSVSGVLAIEKLKVRRLGTEYYVDLHVQANPEMSLFDAHILSGKVKAAIRMAVPTVSGASIHMEPFEHE
jgi:cation diffusion facilitator family transporter